MKIIAVIVTYNRLDLLKKCINAVHAQSQLPDEIIVINNGSTDKTEEWLLSQPLILYSQKNIGGAGGFAYGINMAYKHGADWIWVMDDDTIPEKDALKELVYALNEVNPDREKVGFLSSRVLWKDGNEHEINKTYKLYDQKKLSKLTLKQSDKYPFIQFGTFVSMLLSAKAVAEVGLPIKDFFIWSDDVEFSKRIIHYGLAGLAVDKSVVVHETPINHISSVFKDTPAQLWKYNYGLRNELYTKRLHDGELQFWVTWVHRMFIMPFRIAINRKDNKWAFTKVVWKTSLNALGFRPVIERVEKI
ncbi:glycosyltransferase family 2 protein [Pedobacter mucosus]|uniref:glycosyltransferase family 2 protein n=1 Tax=Pedobacter mucosus TaxID=2895286 RepID=UPI001EE4DF24|nr:glycosyltransferase family 2 protein [Pedobacter mucosus]UKT63875.1 glycosyltransferase family 2 protein [Pedobacter mucosus]